MKHTIKLVGCAAFSDSAISFLRGFNHRDDIEHLTDQNQNIIAFNNGYLYDITTDDYRRIGKEDFITKTMSIPYNSNIPDSKANVIYKIVYSFFDDDEQTQYLLKVLCVSLFTNKHEQINVLTGSGRHGKSLIMNLLMSILNDYATVAEPDLLTTKIRNGISCSLVNAKSTRMLLLSEPNNDDGREIKLNNNLIKTITGNDSITKRAL